MDALPPSGGGASSSGGGSPPGKDPAQQRGGRQAVLDLMGGDLGIAVFTLLLLLLGLMKASMTRCECI